MTSTFITLPNRGVLRLSGPDKAPFLQGLVTNDVALLEKKPAIYACLLTAQGKFLHDFFIVADDRFSPGDWLIDCEYDRRADLMKNLLRYKLRSKIELADESDNYNVSASLDEFDAFHHSSPCLFYRDPRDTELGWRVIAQRKEHEHDRFGQGDHQEQWERYERLRIRRRIPDGSRDLEPEKALIMEYGLDRLNAIDFNKGCYMGQEMTARMFFRDLIRKSLFAVAIDGEVPQTGTPITAGGKIIGEMRSHFEQEGLAILKLEELEKAKTEKTELLCGNGILKLI